MPNANLRILVIEDNRDLATEIVDFLASGGNTVELALDGITGLQLAVVNDYDAIVLDLMLPGMDGMLLCRKLRQHGKSTPILMLTARDALEDKIAGLEAGADDYLVKPAELREMEARLKALVRRGTTRTATRRLKVGDLTLDQEGRLLYRGDTRLDLPPIAHKILEFLMERSPQVVRREELEHLVWNNTRPDTDALRAHMHVLRTLIDKPFDKQLLHTIWGVGYQLAVGNEANK
ncbi:MAG TPA: response regulator transcription factor [Sideroxyarcus sp.]|nr:response regulator transcription factor [Sideroxyarcus sp.]